MQCRDLRDQFQQADRVVRPAADIEGLTGNLGKVLLGEHQRADEIVDEKQVAHLLAVAVDRDLPSLIARIRKWATQP